MSDWFSTAVELQREILRAQQAQIEAGKALLDGSEQAAEAGAKVAEANLAAWRVWARFWGGKR